ncbi:MAG: hypothetical protein Q8P51_11620 [Ignavibacteria bacterium]|nr:hypothetical protein [Ignavibacteria bacterium]
MQRIHAIAFSVLLIFLLLSCSKDNNPVSEPVPDETDGRMTVVNDETKLNERVTEKNDDVAVDSLAGLGKVSGTLAFSMKLVAEIAPPVLNGQTILATAVSLDGQYAYISYNVRGETYRGGVDIVQVKGSKTTIRSEVLFNDTKVSSAFIDRNANKLYLAEASGNPTFDFPATVEMLQISGNKLSLAGSIRRVLTSYVATSIISVGGSVYATTGNTGGLYTLTQDSLKIVRMVSLPDVRWVDYDASSQTLAAVQGGGKLFVITPSTGLQGASYSFTGTGIPESKSTVRVIGSKALVAAGDGGVKLMNISNGNLVGSIPRTIVSGLDPSLSVTNAVAASGQYMYISNGEAGVYVAQASQPLENNSGNTAITLTVLGKLRFANQQSVNHVAFDGSTLVIASGLGGVKVVSVSF